jgi:hypothetical protein
MQRDLCGGHHHNKNTKSAVSMNADSSLLTLGLGIGLVLAALGGLIEFLLATRNAAPNQRRELPGCMLYMAGILALAGIIAVLGSFLLNRSVGPALLLGAGILGGFYAGFAILFLSYLAVTHFWPGGR